MHYFLSLLITATLVPGYVQGIIDHSILKKIEALKLIAAAPELFVSSLTGVAAGK
jgi:multisubunit Na+/H+ antiporter MnhC subunit